MSDERRDYVIRELNKIADRQEDASQSGTGSDIEADHSEADDLLVKYINDPEITKAYERIDKWYA